MSIRERIARALDPTAWGRVAETYDTKVRRERTLREADAALAEIAKDHVLVPKSYTKIHDHLFDWLEETGNLEAFQEWLSPMIEAAGEE